MAIYQLTKRIVFPPPDLAEKDGLLAIGGDLSTDRLLSAYRSGIFPWYSEDMPIMWWSPDPRCVLFPEKLKVSKSMRQVFNQEKFKITFDQDFTTVIRKCKNAPRPGQQGTWITDEMEEAYCRFHREGYAHSVEVWQENKLVGGLYGIAIGRCFCGESMFTEVSNASKAGFITLVRKLKSAGFILIDCQIHTSHLASLGAENISRHDFLKKLKECTSMEDLKENWKRTDQ